MTESHSGRTVRRMVLSARNRHSGAIRLLELLAPNPTLALWQFDLRNLGVNSPFTGAPKIALPDNAFWRCGAPARSGAAVGKERVATLTAG